jgi:hypothetical protein
MTNTGVAGWKEEISPYDVGDEVKVVEVGAASKQPRL